MIVIDNEYVDLETPTGLMRTHIVRPAAPGRFPGILMYSEIFQVTAPIHRTAVQLASQGYIVAIPEIYHEYEPLGTVFAYDQAGSDRGNVLKTTKPVSAYDDDARAVLAYLAVRPDCTGRLGVMGICIGGHLAFRAAMNPEVHGAVCFYATDIPTEGRMAVLARLNEVGTRLNWHEVNGAHAFLRDEGVRYDAEHARSMFGLAISLFHRTLAVGIP